MFFIFNKENLYKSDIFFKDFRKINLKLLK